MTGAKSELHQLAHQLRESEIVIYIESRFNDLFVPPTIDRNQVSLRLEQKNGDRDLVKLTHLNQAGSDLGHQSIVITPTRRDPSTDLQEMGNGPNSDTALRNLIEHWHHNIPVGLHAWEAVLREDVSAFEMPISKNTIGKLVSEIEFHKQLVDAVLQVVEAVSPIFLFCGHDCYASATLKNAFIHCNVPSLTLYKYMFNPIYQGPSLNYSKGDGTLYSRRFNAMKHNASRSVWKSMADAARERLDKITEDYNQLSYMRPQSNSNGAETNFYETLTSWTNSQNLDEDGYFLGAEGDNKISETEPVFILALHSFADEAAMYGIDGFAHMFEYFSAVAQGISENQSNARIAVRFHPNTLGKDLHPVEQKDLELQKKLFEQLRTKYNNVVVSCCNVRLGTLASNHRIAVITRWGTIGLECMHLGIPFLCTPLAPYAEFLSEDNLVRGKDDIGPKISSQSRILEQNATSHFRSEGMYQLAASMFFREDGQARDPSFIFSFEGASYLIARGRSDQRVRDSVGPDLADKLIADGETRKEETRDNLKRFLKRNAETAMDADFLERRLGW